MFEKFTGGTKKHYPAVRITPVGVFRFNNIAISKYQLKSYNFGVFFFNEEPIQIGIELANTRSEGCYRFTHRTGTAALCGAAFLSHYQIIYSSLLSYKVEKSELSGLLIISL